MLPRMESDEPYVEAYGWKTKFKRKEKSVSSILEVASMKDRICLKKEY